jgi:FAD/FMN-containing dehydrogenase
MDYGALKLCASDQVSGAQFMTAITCYTGGTTELTSAKIDNLRTRLQGEILLPNDTDYDRARTVWNAAIDKRPALIAQCANAGDVAEAVRFARQHETLVSVRCGGHNIAGKAIVENGLMIDLTPIRDVHVDPENKTATVGGGAELGDLDRATQQYGLATTAGVVTHTGVGGLTLGGGVGRLARKFGLACDNLISVDIVTADGEQITASLDNHSDLFWALRGGGGNFGIATSFKFRLHDIGNDVLYAAATYRLDSSRDALKHFMDFATSAPREVTSQAAFSKMEDGTAVVNLGAVHIAPLDDAEAVLAPIANFGSPLATRLETRPYVEVQADADERFPYGQRYYWKTHLINKLPEAGIDTLIARFGVVPNTRSLIILQQFGGAVRDVGAADTAFANRDAEFDFIPSAVWHKGENSAPLIEWVRGTWEVMKSYSCGVYMNGLGDGDDERQDDAFGDNQARLRRIKTLYDPTNFFRLNTNIIPAE